MNLDLLRPEICLAITAIIAIIVDLFCRHKWVVSLTCIIGLLASIGMSLSLINHGHILLSIGNGLFVLDNYAIFFKILFCGIALLVILASTDYVKRMRGLHGEFHALLLTATLGAMLTAAAQDIIAILLSIELTAISLYALVAMLKTAKSSESAMKYLLLGAINSAILLFGLALIFGFSGTTRLTGIAAAVSSIQLDNITEYAGLLFGLVLTLAGFAFKIAAAPFHMWAPDVYEGAPTPVTLFLSTVSKIAGFCILFRFMAICFTSQPALSHNWGIILAVVSAVTMTAGNLLAVAQTNIKRLLAYSSITQSGYMLTAIAATGILGFTFIPITSSFLYYLVAFATAEVAVFSVIIVVSQHADNDNISDYAGLSKRSPLLACTMTLGLLSLMGLPPLAGFMGKFYVFSQIAQHDLIWLVIIAVVNSVISAYYYLKIIRTIWMDAPASTESIKISLCPKVVGLLACAGILILGVLPALLGTITEWGASSELFSIFFLR